MKLIFIVSDIPSIINFVGTVFSNSLFEFLFFVIKS